MAKKGRNASCPCGSGKKYKNCCGGEDGKKPSGTSQAPPAPPARLGKAAILAAVTAALLAAILYVSTQDGPFIYDDLWYVRDNVHIRQSENFVRMWLLPYPPDHPEQGLYRPVTALSFMVDYRLHGLDAGGYHVTNVFLHAVATGLFTLLVALLGTPALGALAAGLIFGAHPVHTEAVAWIVGRAEVLAGLFTFAAILAWATWRRRSNHGWLAASMVCYFLAICSKESAGPLPGVLFLADFLGFFPPPAEPPGRERSWLDIFTLRRLWPYAAYAGVIALWLKLRLTAIGQFGMVKGASGFTGEEESVRVYSGLGNLWEYLRLTLWPVALRVHYGGGRYRSLLDPQVIVGVCVCIGLPVAVWLLRKRSSRAAFWTGWFVVFLYPFSNLLFSVGAIIAERLLYISSAAVCALVGMGIAEGLAPKRSLAARVGTGLAAMALLFAFSWGTVSRVADWLSEERFWRRELFYTPSSRKATFNLASYLWEKGKKTGDARLKEESDGLMKGVLKVRDWKTNKGTSDDGLIMVNYATHRRESGDLKEAEVWYHQLDDYLTYHPLFKKLVSTDYFVYWGVTLEGLNRFDRAAEVYEKALKVKPDWPGVLVNLGNMRRKQGKVDESLVLYRRAVEKAPALTVGWLNLGFTLADLKRRDEAVKVAEEMGRALPRSAENLFSRGIMAAKLGDKTAARSFYREALAIDPAHARAKKALEDLDRG